MGGDREAGNYQKKKKHERRKRLGGKESQHRANFIPRPSLSPNPTSYNKQQTNKKIPTKYPTKNSKKFKHTTIPQK